MNNGRPQTFVHITTEENYQTRQRELCLRRCERLAWVRAVIEHADDPRVLVWEKAQQTSKRWDVRTYLFLGEENFFIILNEIKHGYFLITAIYVDRPHQRRKHLKAYQDYKKANS